MNLETAVDNVGERQEGDSAPSYTAPHPTGTVKSFMFATLLARIGERPGSSLTF